MRDEGSDENAASGSRIPLSTTRTRAWSSTNSKRLSAARVRSDGAPTSSVMADAT
jgi:hypothetical protein